MTDTALLPRWEVQSADIFSPNPLTNRKIYGTIYVIVYTICPSLAFIPQARAFRKLHFDKITGGMS